MRTCTICAHPHRAEIEQMLISNVPLRKIGFKTKASTLQRHRPHIPQSLALAAEAKKIELGADLLGDIKKLLNKAQALLIKAERTKDIRTALVGVREIGRLLELKGRVTGELTAEPGTRTPQAMFILPPNTSVSVVVTAPQTSAELRNVTPRELPENSEGSVADESVNADAETETVESV